MLETLATWYLSLARRSAPAYWRTAKPLERATMEYEDEVGGGFLKWFPSLSLAGKDFLISAAGLAAEALGTLNWRAILYAV